MSWSSYLAEEQGRFRQELLELLRIPSVSALPDAADSVRKAGEWVRDRMIRAGLEGTRLLETGGHPVVFGEKKGDPSRPTVLIYGHFDTQPADPEELWDQPPFEPVLTEDRITARGATDDKGNMLIPILALEAMVHSNREFPLNLKFFFEGQEEIGSPQLPQFVASHRELLGCDFVLSADGVQWAEDEPALVLGLRGLACVQIDVEGPNRDLHSGGYGGAVQNPNHALARVLASMRDDDGRIAIRGFYDGVRAPSPEQRREIAEVPVDLGSMRSDLEVEEFVTEPGYTPVEGLWVRPTLEVNGMWGGFQGEGAKTVIPREAHAKITCRLVEGQEPERIVTLIRDHVDRVKPPGVRVEIQDLGGAADPYEIPEDHPGNRIAAEVLEEVFGRPALRVRVGGSIPVCSLFRKELGAFTVGFAFGLLDELQHSPNEFFRLKSFERGQRAYCRIFERLADQSKETYSARGHG